MSTSETTTASRQRAYSEAAARRIRTLGWLTLALAVSPYFWVLPLTMKVAFSPDRGGPGGPIGGRSFDLGICCVLAVLPAPFTLLGYLTSRGLFRHCHWARVVTLLASALLLISTVLLGIGGAYVIRENMAALNRGLVSENEEIDLKTGQFVKMQRVRDYSVYEQRQIERGKFSATIFYVLLAILFFYSVLAQSLLWRTSIREVFCNSAACLRE